MDNSASRVMHNSLFVESHLIVEFSIPSIEPLGLFLSELFFGTGLFTTAVDLLPVLIFES